MRRAACAVAGATVGWGTYQRVFHPLHIVWDLDETLLHSITPISKAEQATLALPADRYFDHIDDDFKFVEGVPNTRTVLRPGAITALRCLGLIATQHVYTAAQGTYTDNILDVIDPSREVFSSVIHRDIIPHHDHATTLHVARGKDLTHLTDQATSNRLDLNRTFLFDNRTYNFEPQPLSGIHVRDYTTTDVEFGRDFEMLRLVFISAIAFLAPDVRSVLSLFRTARHEQLVKGCTNDIV